MKEIDSLTSNKSGCKCETVLILSCLKSGTLLLYNHSQTTVLSVTSMVQAYTLAHYLIYYWNSLKHILIPIYTYDKQFLYKHIQKLVIWFKVYILLFKKQI